MLRIIQNTAVVYWPGAAADAANNAKQVRANTDLETSFGENVAKLVEEMYRSHQIVLSIPSSGWLRTFQKQYELATIPNPSTGKLATGAGPGESNHNFGMAVDIGFNGFKWLKADGSPEIGTAWLGKLGHAKAGPMWRARNQLARPLNLFETSLPGDLIHLQNFDDTNINTRNSLANLLNLAGSLRWQVVGQTCSCDLGFGGRFYPVGKSEDIWGLRPTLTAAGLGRAQRAARKRVNASVAALQAMKVSLKADFQAAEAQRLRWVPLP